MRSSSAFRSSSGVSSSNDRRFSEPAHLQSDPPAVLVVEDDLGTRETIDWVLGHAGYAVATASSAAEGMTMLRTRTFDLLLIDLRLPDMLGTDLIRAVRADVSKAPFVLMSGWLETAVTVEAMKLGASDVIEKPIALEVLCKTVRSALREPHSSDVAANVRPPFPHAVSPNVATGTGMRRQSVSERWATHVWRACHADEDFKTLADWAKCVGASVSSLSESCYLLGIHPRDARDLARLLRTLITAAHCGCDPETLLDVSDRRTRRTLFARGGLPLGRGARAVSPEDFLCRQRFVASGNEGLNALRKMFHPEGNAAAQTC